MHAYHFRRDKTAFWGEIKAKLPFSEGKWLFPTIFYHLNFQLPHPNRSNSITQFAQISL